MTSHGFTKQFTGWEPSGHKFAALNLKIEKNKDYITDKIMLHILFYHELKIFAQKHLWRVLTLKFLNSWVDYQNLNYVQLFTMCAENIYTFNFCSPYRLLKFLNKNSHITACIYWSQVDCIYIQVHLHIQKIGENNYTALLRPLSICIYINDNIYYVE